MHILEATEAEIAAAKRPAPPSTKTTPVKGLAKAKKPRGEEEKEEDKAMILDIFTFQNGQYGQCNFS